MDDTQDSNGEFEFVESKMSQAVGSSRSTALSLSTMPTSTGLPNTRALANIPPPSALPSFITSPLLSSSSNAVSSSPSSTILVSTKPEFEVQGSHSSTSLQSPLPSATIDSTVIKSPPHSSDIHIKQGSPCTIQPQPSASISCTSETETNSILNNQEEIKNKNDQSHETSKSGWMGWFKGTVQSVSHKVAERAKSSMDTMITTLDPQMKDFINSGGDMDVIVTSDKEAKVSPIKEAFQKSFGKATVTGYASQPNDIAAQPVGYKSALQAAEERINNLRASGKIHPQQPVLSIENFIVELMEDYWVEMGLILLDDPWHDIILQTYTQPIPIPDAFVDELKESTAADYPHISTGFSKTLGEVASKHYKVHHSAWQEAHTGTPRRDFVLLAAKTLAQLYKARLPTDVI